MSLIFLDTEFTAYGDYSHLNLIQYAVDDGEVIFVRANDKQGLITLLKLLLDPQNTLVGFFLKEDLYQLYKHYEKFNGKLVPPFKCQAIDLYNHLLMKKPINQFPVLGKKLMTLARIPAKYVDYIQAQVTSELESRLPDKEVFKVEVNRTDKKGKFITLKFGLSISKKLKSIARLFSENAKITTIENTGWLLPSDFVKKRKKVIEIDGYPDTKSLVDSLWFKNERILDNQYSIFWQYAKKDIEYTRGMYAWLNRHNTEKVKVEYYDDCMHCVAYTRYHGFPLDQTALNEYRKTLAKKLSDAVAMFNFNIESSKQRLEWLNKEVGDSLGIPIRKSDKKSLKALAGLVPGELGDKIKVLADYKKMKQECDQAIKFGLRVHPDFRIIGTGTYRMSGTGGTNFQGVSKDSAIRELIKTSYGGDFDNLEMVIAAKMFRDEEYSKMIASGADLHAVTTQLVFPQKWGQYTLDQLKVMKETNKDFKKDRNVGKGFNFKILYFGDVTRDLAKLLDCSEEEAERIMNEGFFTKFPSLKRTRQEFYNKFCTYDFSKWKLGEMARYVENAFGTRRHVAFIADFVTYLVDNLSRISIVAKNDSEMLERREGKVQKIQQTIRSAFLGSIGGVQKTLYRQLGNYPIQSTGAELTKKLMARLWSKYRIPLMNIHDELICPSGYEHLHEKTNVEVTSFLVESRRIIPYLNMEWKQIKNWSEK